mmetsp:Transcript_105177/g.166001  ORF Transcript_105177/g.166001 Transcript_105177/m.166001 type:complete len:183 (+) Transcript_105177:73-621(+)
MKRSWRPSLALDIDTIWEDVEPPKQRVAVVVAHNSAFTLPHPCGGSPVCAQTMHQAVGIFSNGPLAWRGRPSPPHEPPPPQPMTPYSVSQPSPLASVHLQVSPDVRGHATNVSGVASNVNAVLSQPSTQFGAMRPSPIIFQSSMVSAPSMNIWGDDRCWVNGGIWRSDPYGVPTPVATCWAH